MLLILVPKSPPSSQTMAITPLCLSPLINPLILLKPTTSPSPCPNSMRTSENRSRLPRSRKLVPLINPDRKLRTFRKGSGFG